ncbi:COP9 signalosome complex subunit 4 [Lignoscripta atroalba]|nr:COP9 signalosome complex subunit 4 [Lignoscripta atroalba]
MASLIVKSTLTELESSSTSLQNKSSGYSNLLNEITTTSQPSELSFNLAAFIDSILGDSLGIVAARPLLGSYVEALRRIASSEVKIEAGQHALQALQSRVVSFEEQDVSIREILADAYQEQEDYAEAAKVLQGIQLESSQRKVSDDTKVRTWIRICRLYLEEDDTTSAESYLNRAKNLLYKVDDKELNLMFQLSQARILDARRRFLDASEVYHSFSFSPILDEEERRRALSSAIICAVLAPAGPQRSRALAKLFKDERATLVEEYGILEKMFLDRLLSPIEVAKFADKLALHQLAQTADGSTVLAKAVTEHNLLGASRLYNNIGLDELGMLLGLDGEKAEEYAARMLEQGRLNGRIDQIEGVIFFEGREGSGKHMHADQVHPFGARGLRRWDSNVQGATEEVERVTSLLQSLFP